ncbi:MAG: hypothetical protein AABW48_04830 [Nanoarchaeota archaeon]
MKTFFVIVCLLAISLLVVSCTTGKALYGAAPLCGNDQLDADEECDSPSDNSGYFTAVCNDLGFDGGTIGCNAYCKLDTSRCGPKLICTPNEWYCKDGSEQPLRVQCNWQGTNLTAPVACPTGQSCKIAEVNDEEVGVCAPMVCTPGTKMCKDSATTSTCLSGGFGYYNKKCLKGQTCVKGTCIKPGCGNYVAESGEACDGPDLAGKSCTDINFYGNYNYAGGQLTCSGCQFITSSCTKPTCMSMYGIDEHGHPYTCYHQDDVNKPSGELYQVYEVPCDVTQGAYIGQPGSLCGPNTNSTVTTVAGSIS